MIGGLGLDTGPSTRNDGCGFVDLHSHVLPGVDDGPDSWESAVELLRGAAASGTTHIVATPHGDHRGTWDTIASLRELCRDVTRTLAAEQIHLTLSLGMENPLELDTADKLDRGGALTLNSSAYVLVELPFQILPLYWEEALFRIQLQGYHPIIAHPERQAQLQENPDLLAGPVSRGVLTQMTASSLAGGFGPKVKKASEAFFKKGLASLMASDCHSHAGSRGPDMRTGVEAGARLVGKTAAVDMVSNTPRAIVGLGE